jgi:hypothetical protein
MMISPETWELRQKALRKYGGKCLCSCGCVEHDLRLLQFDHINGLGGKEREKVRGLNFYRKLMKEEVSPLLQPLCANCHFLKSQFNTCSGWGLIIGQIPIYGSPTNGGREVNSEGEHETGVQLPKKPLHAPLEIVDDGKLLPEKKARPSFGVVKLKHVPDLSSYELREPMPLPVPRTWWQRLLGVKP